MAVKWADTSTVNNDLSISSKVSMFINAVRHQQGDMKYTTATDIQIELLQPLLPHLPDIKYWHESHLKSLARDRETKANNRKLRRINNHNALIRVRDIAVLTKDISITVKENNIHIIPENWKNSPNKYNPPAQLAQKRESIRQRAEIYSAAAAKHFRVPAIRPKVRILANRETLPSFTRRAGKHKPKLNIHVHWDNLQLKSTDQWLIASKLYPKADPATDGTDVKIFPVWAWDKTVIRLRFRKYRTDEDQEIPIHAMWLAYTPTNSSICAKRSTAIQSVRTKVRNNVMSSFGGI
jgi:hypothetical protein